MDGDAEEPLLQFRAPVSGRYWREYGVPVGIVAGGLLVLAVSLAESAGEAAVSAAVYLGLSLGAILSGLAVYNVVVVALLLTQR